MCTLVPPETKGRQKRAVCIKLTYVLRGNNQ